MKLITGISYLNKKDNQTGAENVQNARVIADSPAAAEHTWNCDDVIKEV
jgi:hypothetical protein